MFFLYIIISTGYYKKTKTLKKDLWNVSISFWSGKNKKHQYACGRFRDLSEKEKIKKRQYGHKRYANLTEDEKLF